ncbi:MAG: sensor histidine kinase [Thermodesulfobacteriota bacterium]
MDFTDNNESKKIGFLKKTAAAVFTLFFALYLGLTITFQYNTHNELNKTRNKEHQKEIEKRAISLNYFFTERQNDLNDIASGNAVTSYFENKALGMSLKYGLRSSILNIEKKFNNFIFSREYNNKTIYSKILLADKENKCIASASEFENFSQSDKNECKISKTADTRKLIFTHKNFFIIKTPVFFKNKYKGNIFAWINKDLIINNFLDQSEDTTGYLALFSDKGEITATSSPDEKNLSLLINSNLQMFKSSLKQIDFSGKKINIYKKGLIKFFGANLSQNNYYLIEIIPENSIKEPSPLIPITAMLILFSGAVIFLGLWWRLNSLNTSLQKKISREIAVQEIIKEKNTELEKEVKKRKAAEKNLFLANKNLENKVKEKTANLEKTLKRLRVTQSQLVQSEKMASIGQLSAGIAHEINNPLGFIKTNISTLKIYVNKIMDLVKEYEEFEKKFTESYKDELDTIKKIKIEIDLDYIKEDIKNLFEETDEGIKRILAIITDLKFFAHHDNEELTETDIHKCIDSTLNVIHNEIKYKAEVIKKYYLQSTVKCYPQRINQILTNIIINAAQSIKDKGEITIETYKNNGYAVIKISDTGEGIPDNIKDRIFDPFFSTKPVGQGTGLGLHVVYDLVKKHKGKIKIESRPDQGTSFYISLPFNPRNTAVDI